MTDHTDHTAIEALLTTRRDALLADAAAAICATYTADAIVFNLAPPLVQPAGATRDVKGLQTWIAEKGGSVYSQVRDLTITVNGDLAVCSSLASMGAPPQAEQQFTLWYRSTLALRREGGAWMIFHEHESTPFYMDDMKNGARAAVDLQP